MDVYLTEEAVRLLRSLDVLSDSPRCGFLVGHACGPRIYIENIIPAGEDCVFSYARIDALNRITGGETVGFLISGTPPSIRKRLLKPFAFGKVCLEAGRDPRGRRTLQAFLIEYDGVFRFSPIPVTSGRDRRRHGI